MIQNLTNEPRAISLPPLSEFPLAESLENEQYNVSLKVDNKNTVADSSPLKLASELRALQRPDNCEDLGISVGMFQGCSESDLYSPASIDINLSNIRYPKHSPSECGSAVTDEDSGCHLQYCPGSTRNVEKGKLFRASSFSALESRSVYGFGTRDEFIMAMTEDLAEWLARLYPEMAAELDANNFFDRLSDGVLLCHHASEIHFRLENFFLRENGEFKLQDVRIGGIKPILPPAPPYYQSRGFSSHNLAGGSFWARDNVASFLKWCRAMHLPDSILFETEDLVSKKNLRSVIVCLLELARFGGRLGIEVPDIIYLEKEIDDEIAAETMSLNYQGSEAEVHGLEEEDNLFEREDKADNKSLSSKALLAENEVFFPKSPCSKAAQVELDALNGIVESNMDLNACNQTEENKPISKLPKHIYNKAVLLRSAKTRNEHPAQRQKETLKREEEIPKRPKYNRPVVDMRSLDEMVRDTLAQCTCEQTFPMVRLSECRYLFGDKSTQIFVRILRSHVMVRVGGGWDTLNHFLQKYDECRKVPHTDLENGRSRHTHENNNILENVSPRHVLNSVSTVPSQIGMVDSSSDSQAGAIIGQGALQVVKKGREVMQNCTAKQQKSSYITSRCNHHKTEQEPWPLTNNANLESLLEPRYKIEHESARDSKPDETLQNILSSDVEIILPNFDGEKPIENSREEFDGKSYGLSSATEALPDDKMLANGTTPKKKTPSLYRKSSTITSIYAPKMVPNRTLGIGAVPKTGNKSSSNLETLSSSAMSLGNLSDITFTKTNNTKIPQSRNMNLDKNTPRRGSLFTQADTRLSQRTRSVSNLTSSPSKSTTCRSKNSNTQHIPNVFTRLSARPTNKSVAIEFATPTPFAKQRGKSIPNLNVCVEKKPFRQNTTNIPIDWEDSGAGHVSQPSDLELKTISPSEQPASKSERYPISVARAPVEGTRIPRPSNALMTKTSRSKSTNSQLHVNT